MLPKILKLFGYSSTFILIVRIDFKAFLEALVPQHNIFRA